jgi:hypothetical protein
MNDTGSDVLTIFDVDMPFLGNYQGYNGWVGPIVIEGAGGIVGIFQKIHVQVQMVRDDNSPWSDWILEVAIVRPLEDMNSPNKLPYSVIFPVPRAFSRKDLSLAPVPLIRMIGITMLPVGPRPQSQPNPPVVRPLQLFGGD